MRVEVKRLSNLTGWGLFVRKSEVQLQRDVLIPSWLSVGISLEGITVLNAELKSVNSILTLELGLSRWVRAE